MKRKSKWDSDSEDEGGKGETIQCSSEVLATLPADEEKGCFKKLKVESEDSAVDETIDQAVITQTDTSTPIQLRIENDKQVPKSFVARAHNPIFDGCRSVDCYQRLNFIDQGTYGMVFRAKCKITNELYALKQVKLGAETNKVGFPVTALREINILLALQHPYIVRVKEMVVGSSIDKVYMVMEYCENDLKTCMKLNKQSFSTAEVKSQPSFSSSFT
jgi:cell division cycle 2-like protein